MIAGLARTLRDRWPELGLPGPRPHRLTILPVGDVDGAHGSVHLVVLRDDEPRPVLAGRIPRDGGARLGAEREDDLLAELATAAPRLAGRAFPRPLPRVEAGGRLATFRTLLPGSAGGSWDHAAAWLETLWGATGLLEGLEGPLWEPVLRIAHERLADPARPRAERASLAGLVAGIGARARESALSAYGHGDPGPARLVRAGDSVGALGWDHGRRRQLPWTDPVGFAIEAVLAAAVARGETPEAALERAFLAPEAIGGRPLAFLSRTLAEGGVPLEVLPLALPAGLLLAARRAERRLGAGDPRRVARERMAARALAPDVPDALAALAARPRAA